MNPNTIEYVWTGEYDLNTLRVDEEIFESATKKLRIRKYPYTCGQGLILYSARNQTYIFYHEIELNSTLCYKHLILVLYSARTKTCTFNEIAVT